jgi:hypothetical protein
MRQPTRFSARQTQSVGQQIQFTRRQIQFTRRQTQFTRRQTQFTRRQIQFTRRQTQFTRRKTQFARRLLPMFPVRTGRRWCGLARGLKAGGLKPGSLSKVKGSDPRKVLLADLLWRRTVVSQEWLAAKLEMSSAANVSQQLKAS